MKTKHTPAPWTYNETYGLIVCQDKGEIAACHSGIKANARLIAAAPDMLEALQDLEAMLHAVTHENFAPVHNHPTIERARKVINKAKGE